MTVVGGTYRERSADPRIDHVYGSGMRASGILSSLGNHVRLDTCIDDQTADEARAVANVLGIEFAPRPRDHAVTFAYETPISPAFRVGMANAEQVDIRGDTVLGFGMVECEWQAYAETLVVDPQHSPLDRILERSHAARVAVILNGHEASRLTGGMAPRAAAQDLLTGNVDVVVVKQGALGGIVATKTRVDTYGAVPTSPVQPLGSGDAFSAGFTHKWATTPDSPAVAAEFASGIAACHSLTGVPQIDPRMVDDLPPALPYAGDARPRVYLAGPFFAVAERHLIRHVRAALHQIGADVFSPFDDVGVGGDEVAQADLDGLAGCHAVLALVDGADPGTLFEAGWATHADIPVVALAENITEHSWTMLRGTGATVVSDLSTALYLATWAAIEATARS